MWGKNQTDTRNSKSTISHVDSQERSIHPTESMDVVRIKITYPASAFNGLSGPWVNHDKTCITREASYGLSWSLALSQSYHTLQTTGGCILVLGLSSSLSKWGVLVGFIERWSWCHPWKPYDSDRISTNWVLPFHGGRLRSPWIPQKDIHCYI